MSYLLLTLSLLAFGACDVYAGNVDFKANKDGSISAQAKGGNHIKIPKHEAGLWEPLYIATGSSNVASSSGEALSQYSRTDNTVNFAFNVLIDPSASSVATLALFSIPIASDFTNARDIIGTCATLNTTGDLLSAGMVEAKTDTDKFQVRFRVDHSANANWFCTGMYQIK